MKRLAEWLGRYELVILYSFIFLLNLELGFYKSGGHRVVCFVVAGGFAACAVAEAFGVWKWGDRK